MGLARFQRALARLLVDPAARMLLRRDLQRFAREYRLTDRECADLAALPERELAAYTSSLERKRAHRLRRATPGPNVPEMQAVDRWDDSRNSVAHPDALAVEAQE